MKNPMKYFKHLVKDPVHTVEAANKRRKEILPWFLGSLGVGVLSGLLGEFIKVGIIQAIMSILTFVGVAGIMFFGFLLWVVVKAKKKFVALTCDDCKTMATFNSLEEYLEHVQYTVEESIKTKVKCPNADNNGVIYKISVDGYGYATAKIKLKCPNCGKVRELIYKVQPFHCEAIEEKVPVRNGTIVKMELEKAVNEVMKQYEQNKEALPYTIQSIHHPEHETFKTKTVSTISHPKVGLATIKYHRDIDEMIEGFFLHNELNGTLTDPNKSKK